MRQEHNKRGLAPSILAADFNRLGEQLSILKDNSIEVLHLDVMDGMFVPSISFGIPVIASIRKEFDFYFDVHLMIHEPIRYITAFKEAGADSITIHVEACENVQETIDAVKSHGLQCGIALNPETPIEHIVPYLGQVDLALVMSVRPGFGGQKFMPDALDKVKRLDEYRVHNDLQYTIEIDGGIKRENASLITEAGVDLLVAGTAVFHGDIAENINAIRRRRVNAS